jgi:transcriptional regulator with XRE-family HTH domain
MAIIMFKVEDAMNRILAKMPVQPHSSRALERQLLLQLGERLKHARRSRGLSSAALAGEIGISRTTLQAVEAGEASPAIGTYVRVMSSLGLVGDLALLATGEFTSASTPTALATRAPPASRGASAVLEEGLHAPQDLQSLLLHKEAVKLIKQDPSLVDRARQTLHRWRARGASHSLPLWDEWERILDRGDWRRAVANTQRGRQLRQASPLPTLLPDEVRRRVLAEVRALRPHASARSPHPA